MGLSESNLTTLTKPLSLLSHCKVSCYSSCCTTGCGEDNISLIPIHTKTLAAIAIAMKMQIEIFQNGEN